MWMAPTLPMSSVSIRMAEPSIRRPAMPERSFSEERSPSSEREAVLPPTRKPNKVQRERERPLIPRSPFPLPQERAAILHPMLGNQAKSSERETPHTALSSPFLSLHLSILSLLVSLSEMGLRCLEVDGPPKPPPTAATMAGPSSSIPFGNPTLQWGSTHLMRCQINSDRGNHLDRRPSSASPPPPPQSKNDPSPSSSRPRLVLRIPLRARSRKPERDEPSSPEKQQDHRQEDRKVLEF